MNKLQLTKTKYTLRFNEQVRLPIFVGNTLRGALGWSLCNNYPEIYEEIFKHESPNRESTPNPFAVSVSYPGKNCYQQGEELEFSITLIGSACRHEEDINNAVSMMCGGKLTGSELTATEQMYSREWSDAGADTIPHCDMLTIKFLTPTEIMHSKKPIDRPDFHSITASLFGRISKLIDNFTDNLFVLPYSLSMAKPNIRAQYEIEPVYHKINKQPLNGFIGTARYFGDVTRYLPYIDLGSQIHIGKKTTRSCGEYIFSIS